ncbi:hypothetical protein D3C73_1176890 [compost metagenome]
MLARAAPVRNEQPALKLFSHIQLNLAVRPERQTASAHIFGPDQEALASLCLARKLQFSADAQKAASLDLDDGILVWLPDADHADHIILKAQYMGIKIVLDAFSCQEIDRQLIADMQLLEPAGILTQRNFNQERFLFHLGDSRPVFNFLFGCVAGRNPYV